MRRFVNRQGYERWVDVDGTPERYVLSDWQAPTIAVYGADERSTAWIPGPERRVFFRTEWQPLATALFDIAPAGARAASSASKTDTAGNSLPYRSHRMCYELPQATERAGRSDARPRLSTGARRAQMAMTVIPNTGEADSGRAWFRLSATQIDAIEFVARGELEGESGVKSISAAGADVSAGVAKSSALAMHNSTAVEDFDELFDKVDDYLASGFTFAEVAQIITHSPGEVHLIALERWANRIGLECLTDTTPARWKCGSRHRHHTRARRTFDLLRREGAHQAANVLFTVYGWPDPFVGTLARDVQDALGREFASLARYTDAVEDRRLGLVDAEARAALKEVPDLGDYVSRRRWADRCISSTDAIRAALAHVSARGPNETKTHHEERVTAGRIERDRFISAIRIDANRMLSEASRLFEAAWHRV